jgi:spermidine/putrescine transport system substrate-binding protein
MRSVVALMIVVLSAVAGGKELYIYNWSEYMPKVVIENFTKETGIKVHYETYDSNEEMRRKIGTKDAPKYDIIVPSTYCVKRMIRENKLSKIDKSKLSNYKNLDKKLLSRPFDIKNEYSVPYLWGTTGISYNPTLVKATVDSWADLWNKEYKQSVLLNDDMREVFGMALKLLGYSANSTNPKEIEEAYNKLLELKPNIKMFFSGSQTELYVKEKVKLGMSFNGEGFMAEEKNEENKLSKMILAPDTILGTREEKREIKYIYPKEGVLVWMDSLVIPKGAKNVENAHVFINYLLRPEVAKLITRDIGYASPNLEAIKLLDKAIQNNRTIYPTDADLQKSEFLNDTQKALSIYEKYWKMLKAK